MSINLLDSVNGLFSNDLVRNAASSLGESDNSIHKFLSGAIPTILAGVVNKASTTDGASGILGMAKEAFASGGLQSPGAFLPGGNPASSLAEKGSSILSSLFGDKLPGIINLISSYASIKQSSASSLLSMAAPAALGVLGKHVSDNNLSAGGLMNFLAAQKDSILRALPAGLGTVAGMLGPGSLTAPHAAVPVPDEARRKSNLLVPLIFALLVVVAGIYFFKGCANGKTNDASTVVTDSSVTKTDTVSAAPVMATGAESIKVKLPNGKELDAYKGGIEDRLVSFLGTDYAKLGADSLKKVWFDFDNLNFKTASAEITPGSQKQVDNIAAILQAFPSAKLKIGGYTDKTGNEASNKKLSDARAKAVKAALDKAGVGKQITDAEGYGSAMAQFPSTAPETDREKDRRVSVSVRL